MFGLKRKSKKNDIKEVPYPKMIEDNDKETATFDLNNLVEPHNVVRDNNNLGDYLNNSYNDAENERIKTLIGYLIEAFKAHKEVDTQFGVDDYFIGSSILVDDPELVKRSRYLNSVGYDIIKRHYDYIKTYFENRGIRVTREYQDKNHPFTTKDRFVFSWGDLKEEDKANNLTTVKIDGNAIKCKDWSEEIEELASISALLGRDASSKKWSE